MNMEQFEKILGEMDTEIKCLVDERSDMYIMLQTLRLLVDDDKQPFAYLKKVDEFLENFKDKCPVTGEDKRVA